MKRTALFAATLLTAAASADVLPFAEALKPEPPPAPAPVVPAVPDVLTLDQALRFSLENNFSIRQARERLREQEGLIVEVRAQAIPNVAATAGYTRDAKSLSEARNGGPVNYQNWRAAITVRQLVYSGGGVNAALDAAKTTRTAAVLDIEAVVNDVLLLVRTRFADVLLNRERILVQEQGVALLKEQLQTAQNRFAAGSVSQFEVLTAEVALANAQPALISARNGLRVAIDELRAALGYQGGFGADLQKVPEFTGTLEYRPVSYDLQASLSAAKARRPELLRLAQLQRARESGVTVSKSNYLPEVYLTGGYEGVKRSSSNSLDDSLDGWTAGVEASWAIFDGARTRGKVTQARALLNQARLSLAEQTLAVEVEVRRALSSLQEAAELAEAAGKVVGQAQEALRLADVRYRNGAATQLDVLQARQALTEASLNRLEANYRHTLALATVRKAIGESDPVVAAVTP
jgi:outer membrane protein TolC